MNTHIIHFIKRMFLFGLTLVLVYPVFICIWGDFAPNFLKKNLNYKRGGNGHLFTRVLEVKNIKKNTDVLFLGSSHAYRGFDTRIFEKHKINSFNLGSSAQTPIQSEVLIDRYLKRINPEKVVFEVNPASFINDGVESAIDLISNDINTLGCFKMALKINHIKVYNTLIYGVYNDLLRREESFVENPVKGNQTYVKGGYVESKLEHYVKTNDTIQRTWQWNQSQFEAFEKVCEKIRSKNIELILVQAPITKSTYSLYDNNDEFDSRIREYDYGIYYNFNNKVKLDDEKHFADFHHLNQDGVNVFNNYFIENILKNHLN